MFFDFKLLTILLLASPMVMGQQAGTQTPEVHPPLPWQQCQKDGHCTQVHGEIVIDANWRKILNAQGQDCYKNNQWDPAICPDDATCAKNCALEGVNYTSLGVTTSGNSLTMYGNNLHTYYDTRLYLMANSSHYQLFNLLAQEFSFDVDMSTLPCGLNGALYLISMEADGGQARFPANKAGAKYGTGYCDSQCERDKFIIHTQANSSTKHFGACCSEMDLWEANSVATAYTPHPCTTAAYHNCEGAPCGSTCDSPGCDFNPYRMGDHSFYGPNKTVDTNKVFTIVTQFITSDGTPNGTLTEIKRFYVQDGKVIPNSQSTIAGAAGNSISQEFCANRAKSFKESDSFTLHGGLKQMGEAIRAGMVLSASLWDAAGDHMTWLDSVVPKDAPATQPGAARGPCAVTSGVPAEIESPNVHVVWSNIKVGPINSTFHA